MYTQVFNDYRDLPDPCTVNPDHTTIRRIQQNGVPGIANLVAVVQQYLLRPNPSEGIITITQTSPDSKPVALKIWNAAGQTMYTDTHVFNGGQYSIKLENVISGLYLLEITDGDGKHTITKFIISK